MKNTWFTRIHTDKTPAWLTQSDRDFYKNPCQSVSSVFISVPYLPTVFAIKQLL